MIRSKINLICSQGHRHYSPTPEHFVGRLCFYPTETGSTKRRCQEVLRRVRRVRA